MVSGWVGSPPPPLGLDGEIGIIVPLAGSGMNAASTDSGGPIIVFDAMCVLCSANAAFVLRYYRAGRFRLALMQGATGTALYRQVGIDAIDPETMIVVHDGRAFRDSDAVLAVWAGLDRP